jgi:hypothetical protein
MNDAMAKRLIKATVELENIIEYLWEKELKDFKCSETGAQEHHIFRDLVAVDNAIYGTKDKPEDYLEE